MNKQFDLQNLVRNNVKLLKPYSSARDEFHTTGEEMIFLDANENPFPTTVNRYPDPQQKELKQVIGDLKGIEVRNILLGNGSDEVLDLLYRAFCEPGKDNVITLPPTYGMYGVLAGINNVENREVLLSMDFQPNVEGVLGRVDAKTKIIFLCSPNNPTGNSFSEESILNILQSFSGLVVIDEAYIDFSQKESWIKRLQEFSNLVIIQTLSKAYGLAGIRLGICIASQSVIGVLNKIKPPYNVNELSQNMALERLKEPQVIYEEVTGILNEKERLIKVLLDVKFVSEVFKSDANFMLIRVDDANRRYEELIKNGIVVRNRSNQPLCENTLRITVGTSAENDKLIKVLKGLI
ncbi:histidinol-phosphate transaminase [soil metagenome]